MLRKWRLWVVRSKNKWSPLDSKVFMSYIKYLRMKTESHTPVHIKIKYNWGNTLTISDDSYWVSSLFPIPIRILIFYMYYGLRFFCYIFVFDKSMNELYFVEFIQYGFLLQCIFSRYFRIAYSSFFILHGLLKLWNTSSILLFAACLLLQGFLWNVSTTFWLIPY